HLGRDGSTLRPPWLDLEGDGKVVNRLSLRVAHGDDQFCCIPQDDERGGVVQREEIPRGRGADELRRTRQAAANHHQAQEQDHMPPVAAGARTTSWATGGGLRPGLKCCARTHPCCVAV